MCQSSQSNQRFFLCGLAIEGRIREDRAGRKRHEVQARAAGPWNDGVGITVKPLLLAEVRDRRVDPDERVFVAGNSLELIGRQRFVALNDGLPAYISGDDTTVSTRPLATLG